MKRRVLYRNTLALYHDHACVLHLAGNPYRGWVICGHESHGPVTRWKRTRWWWVEAPATGRQP